MKSLGKVLEYPFREPMPPSYRALTLYPHAESNRNRQNRNLKFYPLNYRGETERKYRQFSLTLREYYTKPL